MSAVLPRRALPAARWAGALIVVTAVHVAVGSVWLMHASLAPPEPPPAILIDMVPLPSEPVPEPPKPEEPPPPEPPPPEPPPPEPPPTEPPPPEPPPPEPPPPELPPPEEPPPVEIPQPPPDIPPPDEPPPVEPPPPPPPEPPKPPPPKPPPRPVSRPVPRPVTAPAPPQHAPPPVAVPAPPPRGVPVPVSWQSKVFAHLMRHLRYPPEALQRRQQGVPQVRIVIDRAGRVLSVKLEQGSGYPLLDAEAQALVQRAQPLPPLPDDVTASTVEVVIPLNFRVR